MATTAELYQALRQKAGYEVVKEQVSDRQIRIIGRIPTQLTRNWIVVMHHLLMRETVAPWSLDVSKHYFIREGQVVWGWRIILQAEDVAGHLSDFINVLNQAPKAKFEVQEQKLPGVSGQRPTMTDKGKGASSSLKPQAGPSAVLHAQRVARGV